MLKSTAESQKATLKSNAEYNLNALAHTTTSRTFSTIPRQQFRSQTIGFSKQTITFCEEHTTNSFEIILEGTIPAHYGRDISKQFKK